MQQDSTPVFPRERAFVVQLHGDAGPGTGRWEGRVEHVSSGRFAHFQQLRELDAFFREALSGTWKWFANIRFTGWYLCPTGGIGGSGSAKDVRIRITAQDGSNAGAGGSARLGMDALSSAADNNPGVNLSFNPDGTVDKGRVEYVGVHELGNVLGFVHEQDTPGNVEGPAYCKSPGNEPNSTSLTPYDRDSIMNYCNRDGNVKGNLTDIDVRGVQAIYGVRIPNIASRNSCASAVVRQTASVAWGWNDGSNQTSLALFPSASTRFLDRTAVSVREGGWGDDVKWFAGDFNNDGRTDIGAAWNNGGSNTLSVRQLAGSGINAAHWAINSGGWSPTAVWLPGDFNGDRLTDVAGVWNDGGLRRDEVREPEPPVERPRRGLGGRGQVVRGRLQRRRSHGHRRGLEQQRRDHPDGEAVDGQQVQPRPLVA